MDKCRLVSPTYTELHSAQVNLYTIFERSDLGTRSLAVIKFLILKEVNDNLTIIILSRHLSTRVREHLFSDKNSHIYKHLKSSSACREACNENCFAVLDSAGTAYKRKIKEALHIMWEGPNLNKQLNHYNVSLNF